MRKRHTQRCATGGETRAICRGRLANDLAEGASKCAETVESDVEADLGDPPIGFAQQLHRTLHPPALQVAVRRLAKSSPKLAAEVRGRDMRDTRKGWYVKGLRKRTVHRVASPQHATIAILDGAGHLLKPTTHSIASGEGSRGRTG